MTVNIFLSHHTKLFFVKVVETCYKNLNDEFNFQKFNILRELLKTNNKWVMEKLLVVSKRFLCILQQRGFLFNKGLYFDFGTYNDVFKSNFLARNDQKLRLHQEIH